jgi:molybdenum cofactor cytidylyltransferase
MNKEIAIIILAAGSSSRMGAIKQLLPWKGTTLLGYAIDHARATEASEVVVVLGANADKIKASIAERGISILQNNKWKSGMGSSISCGMQYVLAENEYCKGALVMLCDQPMINTAYLQKLMATFRKEKFELVGTQYGNKVGTPAIFGRSYFASLVDLEGDSGAQDILNDKNGKCVSLEANGLTLDIDTRDDYEKLQRG